MASRTLWHPDEGTSYPMNGRPGKGGPPLGQTLGDRVQPGLAGRERGRG